MWNTKKQVILCLWLPPSVFILLRCTSTLLTRIYLSGWPVQHKHLLDVSCRYLSNLQDRIVQNFTKTEKEENNSDNSQATGGTPPRMLGCHVCCFAGSLDIATQTWKGQVLFLVLTLLWRPEQLLAAYSRRMWLRNNQPRCRALWFFYSLFKPSQKQGQSLQGAEVITFTLNIWKRCGLWAGRRDTGGRRRCSKWQ